MRRSILIWLVVAAGMVYPQTGATTRGNCSPANSGNNNTFNITCGIDKEQGDKLLFLLNEILGKNLDVTRILNEINGKTPKYRGTLIPASDPPSPVCATSEGMFKLILGSGAILNPFNGHALTVGDHDWVAMRLVEGRGLAIDADLTSEDQKLVVQIRKNDFVVNRNITFDVRTPDESTLVVQNDKGLEVLNVRFSNPTTIRMKGVFFLGNGRRLELSDQGFTELGPTSSRLRSLQRFCLGPNMPNLKLFSNQAEGRPQLLEVK